MSKIPDTAQAILWGSLACGGTLVMMIGGAYENQGTWWGDLSFLGGFVALLVGGCALLGLVAEGILREIRDIWHEHDVPVRRHRRRR